MRSHQPVERLGYAPSRHIPELVGPDRELGAWHFFIQRLLDISIAALGLIIALPLMLFIALLIRLDSPGPIIFRQDRVAGMLPACGGTPLSRRLRTFRFYKFRTMYQNADCGVHRSYTRAFIHGDTHTMATLQNGNNGMNKLVEDQRVTRLGRFLRRSSLDELPQLWNVLRGDMTLVGPRPAIPYEVIEYQPWHLRRLEAKPGLTGLWQVTARSTSDFDEMVRLDIWYIEHQSLWLNLRILVKTPFVAILGMGAA